MGPTGELFHLDTVRIASPEDKDRSPAGAPPKVFTPQWPPGTYDDERALKGRNVCMQSLDSAYICDSGSEVDDDEDLLICEQCSSVGERLTEGQPPHGLVCECHSNPPMLFCSEPCLEQHRNQVQAEARTPQVARYELGRRGANVGYILLLESVRCRNKDQMVAGEAWQQELEQGTDGVINEEHLTDRVLFPQWALIHSIAQAHHPWGP